ncbi:hypothetical protein K493DRAFT_335313 [Basidiobolus meristosporus CBS 931.73]|uniref:DUF4243 domain-containing protein n=1 Tax=Basidiobolus meristosporus CBS 931.73 TaxID=1314790 RepID=A0A1Y1YR06_9FUNG|nr:hypothetical protein K493DRAFT_335313 [Basidiobolus meristosporus CBS 931.73]|eukprot:ORY00471.1 hypothetical protein K493DRAFT_335313 [Basidiobolus meristosporus CBS 931.73]
MITIQSIHTPTLPESTTPYCVNIPREVCDRNTLFDLLDEHHRRFHIDYGGYLANHVTHNLFSLYALGATSECLTSHFNQSAQNLERFPPSKINITEENWRFFLGQKKYYTDYVKFFDQRIRLFGLLETFQKYGSILIPGLLGNSLHPLVHLGFGVEFEHPSVTSEGLAYAAMTYLSYGELIDEASTPFNQNLGCRQILEMIRTDKRFDGPFEGQFQAKVKILVKSRADLLKSYVDAWVSRGQDINIEEKLRELTRTVTQIYASECLKGKSNIFLGHILTSSNAVKSLMPHLSTVDRTRLFRVYWLAVISHYIIQGRPHIHILQHTEISGAEQTAPWPVIIHEVLTNQDDKVPNLVRTLMWAEQENGFEDGLYRRAAEMTVNMTKEYEWGVDGIGWWTVK